MRYLSIVHFFIMYLIPITLLANDGWSGDLDINIGYNDNVYLQHNDIEISTDENNGNQDIQHQLNLAAYGKIYNGASSDAKLIGNYFHESLADSDMSTSIFSISLPLSAYGNSNRLRIIPTYTHYNIDGENALDSIGTRIDLTHKLNRYKFGLRHHYTIKSALSFDYKNSEGINQKVALFHRGAWLNKSYSVSLGHYENGYQQTEDGDSTHSGNFVRGSYSYRSKKWGLRVYAIAKSKEYTNYSIINPRRSDTNIRVSISPSYRLSKNTSIYTDFLSIGNRYKWTCFCSNDRRG